MTAATEHECKPMFTVSLDVGGLIGTVTGQITAIGITASIGGLRSEIVVIGW